MNRDQPGFDDVADELSGTAGAMREEWRSEEESFTAAAATRWSHERGLDDVVVEAMHRGDTVAVTAAGRTFRGQVVAAGADLLAVQTPSGRVDLQTRLGTGRHRTPASRAPLVLQVVKRAAEGGMRSGAGATSFRARLVELEAADRPVVLGSTLLNEELQGTLVVGSDQVNITTADGIEIYLPTAWVSYVSPGGDSF